jgi:hypothetical protein
MGQGIEIYIRSFAIPLDIESYRHHRMHSHCAPGLAQTTLDLATLAGRLYEPDSAAILLVLSRVCQDVDASVEVYDVGRLRGRLRALTAWVQKVPTVVVNGKKHVGLNAAKQALQRLEQKVVQGEQEMDTQFSKNGNRLLADQGANRGVER